MPRVSNPCRSSSPSTWWGWLASRAAMSRAGGRSSPSAVCSTAEAFRARSPSPAVSTVSGTTPGATPVNPPVPSWSRSRAAWAAWSARCGQDMVVHCASRSFSASVNSVASRSAAAEVLISSQAPGSAWLFSGSSRSCHSMPSSRSPKTRARSLACDAPVPICRPRTASRTVPCSSNTSRSASTPTPHAVTVA